MSYLVAGCLPVPLDAGPSARLLLLGVDHHSTQGRRAMAQLLPLLRMEVYEWARNLAGAGRACSAAQLPAAAAGLARQCSAAGASCMQAGSHAMHCITWRV